MSFNVIIFPFKFIIEVLEKTAKGKAVIENYKLFALDNPSRVLITECVVENEYGADNNTVYVFLKLISKHYSYFLSKFIIVSIQVLILCFIIVGFLIFDLQSLLLSFLKRFLESFP